MYISVLHGKDPQIVSLSWEHFSVVIRSAMEVEQCLSLTDDSKGEAIAKSCHLIICTAAIDLKYCHSNKLSKERSP